MSTLRHYLDYNQEYWIDLDYNEKTQTLVTTIGSSTEPLLRLVKSLTWQLELEKLTKAEKIAKQKKNGGVDTTSNRKLQTRERPDEERTFTNVSRNFTLYLGQEPIGEYEIGEHGLTKIFHRPLIVDETRRMGTFHDTEPYSQHRPELSLEENKTLLSSAKKAVFTDIHTHSSGHITAEGLLKLALEQKPYHYPVALLEEAGIDTESLEKTMIPRIPFLPKEVPGVIYPAKVDAVDLHALSEDDRKKLIARMALPISRQSTFAEMEMDGYRFRYPFTKDPALVGAIQRKTAEESMAQGLRYITPSYVGLEKPAILGAVHTVIDGLDAEHPDFKQRYMVGIPRGISLEQMREYLEKAKVLLDSPYVVGVDILGFENNKTREFVALMDEFCAWANEHKPGATIRFHAGENDKNLDNVNDFLKMAVKHDQLMFSVGHGLYGIDKETTQLARRMCQGPKNPRLLIEFNPASNIALDNVDDVRQIPFQWAIENEIPFVVSSDSAGMYQTNPIQLGLSAHAAGLDAKGFALLKQHQEYIMRHQSSFAAINAVNIPEWETEQGKAAFVEQSIARLEAVAKAPVPSPVDAADASIKARLEEQGTQFISGGEMPEALQGKRPIVFMGASGESWKRIPPEEQREYAIAVDMILHALGDDCYVVQGRRKDSGLSHVINESLKHVNAERTREEKPSIQNLGIYAGPFEAGKKYSSFDYLWRIPGSVLNLPDAIADYTLKHQGVFVAAGGATFTRNTISKADQRGIRDPDNNNMMILICPSDRNPQRDELFALGASAQKAQVLNPEYRAKDGKQALQKLLQHYPALFPPSLTTDQLETLYIAASKRVDSYRAVVTDGAAMGK